MMETTESLIRQVSSGDISPEEAEEMARESGLPPLTIAPRYAQFDPRLQPFWTLAMATAWIAERSFTSVQLLCDEYRTHQLVWVPQGSGHALRRPEVAVTELMRGTRARGEMPEASWKKSSGYRGAIWSLWHALAAGELQATELGDGGTKEIAATEWTGLRWRVVGGQEVIAHNSARYDQQAYRRLRVAAVDVQRLWPSPHWAPAGLPGIVRPDQPGYMTLFHAALWIATRGGVCDFDPGSDEFWAPAYKVLTDRIAEGEVEVSGFRDGQRAFVPREEFIGIRVSYPSGTVGLWFEDEPHLCSYLILDDEAWNRGCNDSIQGPNGPIWTKLLVANRDVRKNWPFDLSALPGTGAPGRPTSMHLIKTEFDRRVSAGQTALGLRAEARALQEWFLRAHPELRPLTEKTIENNVREPFRDAKKA